MHIHCLHIVSASNLLFILFRPNVYFTVKHLVLEICWSLLLFSTVRPNTLCTRWYSHVGRSHGHGMGAFIRFWKIIQIMFLWRLLARAFIVASFAEKYVNGHNICVWTSARQTYEQSKMVRFKPPAWLYIVTFLNTVRMDAFSQRTSDDTVHCALYEWCIC